jgi:TPR repeat protein
MTHAPTQVKSGKKAAKLWKRGVELGNVDAMVNLSQLYSVGDGVKLDRGKALQLVRAAADRGDANAQWKTGVLLHMLGRGGLGTPQEAFRYYKMSADQGHKLAMYFVGVAYRRGEGVDQDEEEACRWWERGAALGDEGSRHALANMRA